MGACVGIIELIECNSLLGDSTIEEVASEIQALASLCNMKQSYITGSTLHDAFCYTVSMNIDRNTRYPPRTDEFSIWENKKAVRDILELGSGGLEGAPKLLGQWLAAARIWLPGRAFLVA